MAGYGSQQIGVCMFRVLILIWYGGHGDLAVVLKWRFKTEVIKTVALTAASGLRLVVLSPENQTANVINV